MKNIFLLTIFGMLFVMSCGSSDSNINSPLEGNGGSNSGNGDIDSNDWLIPVSEVRDGGPGKDGIPSIDNPKFSTVQEVLNIVSDDLLVIGIKVGNEVRAYPHFILDWHEIINDDIEDVSIAITYCPLTGTGIGWDRIVNGGTKTTFGVSGLLYNNNLLPYDRSTDSNWSQIRLQCVNGKRIGERPKIIPLVETTWGVWKSMYPQTKILNTNTGFSREYSRYPYGDYRTSNSFLIFPVNPTDDRLPSKERVLAVIDNEISKVFRFNSFGDGKVIKDVFYGRQILVVGDTKTIVSFELDSETSVLTFEYDYNNSETFFKDNEGTAWNIFGEAISGPRKGAKLKPKISFIAYWFSIGAFYPQAEIYSE